VSKSLGQELEIDSIVVDSLPKRRDFAALAPPSIRAPEIAIAGAGSASETRKEPLAPSHALIRALSCVLMAFALAGLLIVSRHVAKQRAFDEVAFNDVLGVLKALDRIEDGVVLDLTIRGPGAVPGLPGATVSAGSTLQVRSFGRGRTYVRGANDQGSLTYRFYGGSLYASEE
jgi:hypothetical protein